MIRDERVKAIVGRLKMVRKNAGLSQDEVALRLGYESGATISMLESGRRNLDMVMLLRLCDVYHITPVYALTGMKGKS